MTAGNQREPWKRLDEESSKAFQAFSIYRDAGVDRSIAKVAKETGKNRSLIERWAREHGWVGRVKAYDDYLDEIHLYELEMGRREMQARQTRLSMYLQSIGWENVNTLAQFFDSLPEDEQFNRAQLIKMIGGLTTIIEKAASMERDARGEPNLRIDDMSRPKEIITTVIHTDRDGKEIPEPKRKKE